jgi:7-carboxy-7-deazaguanine synthase
VKISEIFYSVQGEGSLVGMPSVFVRTSGCNLRCVWCDTPYTSWAPEGEDMSVTAILEKVSNFGGKFAVVTGGEPMIAPGLNDLTVGLRRLGMHITIETAGTVFAQAECDLMSISPKLINSIPNEREGGRFAVQHERIRYQPDVLKRLMAAYPYQLKFVVTAWDDIAEIDVICHEIGAPPRNVILMPEGIEHRVLQERSLWITEACKQRGYRFTPRLHVDLWGAKRGV